MHTEKQYFIAETDLRWGDRQRERDQGASLVSGCLIIADAATGQPPFETGRDEEASGKPPIACLLGRGNEPKKCFQLATYNESGIPSQLTT